MKLRAAALLLAAPAATRARLTLPTVTAGYSLSDRNVATCPAWSVPLTSEAECRTAVEAIDWSGLWLSITWGYAVSYTTNPTGCFCGSHRCYFNDRPGGAAQTYAFLVCAVEVSAAPSTWTLAMNINPSDGNDASWHSPIWFGTTSVGAEETSLSQDYKDFDAWHLSFACLAIDRHDDSGDIHGAKVWRMNSDMPLIHYFNPDKQPGSREIVTSGGPVQLYIADGSENIETDPILAGSGANNSLAFNWNHHNNGARIILTDVGHWSGTLPAVDVNDDDSKGLGNDLQVAQSIGASPSVWWKHDAAPIQDDCYGASCWALGTDHGSSLQHYDKYGNYGIYISSTEEDGTCPPFGSSPTTAPTTAPSPSPTLSPTESPTKTPSTSPSAAPTSSPTPAGPWELDCTDVTADFSNANTVTLDCIAGVGRDFRIDLYEKDCSTPVDTALYSTSNDTTPISGNATHHKLTITHSFVIGALAGSDIWNATSSKLEVCQKLHLVHEDMDIIESVREIDVDFDLKVDFNTTVTLKEGVTENATDEVNFQNKVSAFKCNGTPFERDEAALAPNQQLAICIESEDANVDLAELTAMDIKQGEPPEGKNIDVVIAGAIQVEAITEVSDVSKGILVTTRVPIDRFTFGDGEIITVSGNVRLVFASGRRLRVLVGEEDAATMGAEEAGYVVTVNLKSEADGVGGNQAMIGSSSGHAITGKGLGVLSFVVLAAIGFVM